MEDIEKKAESYAEAVAKTNNLSEGMKNLICTAYIAGVNHKHVK